MAEFETIRYDLAEGLASITLARPDKRNAMNAQMFTELGDAAAAATSDPAVRGVLVKAEGSSFSAGIDLGSLSELAGMRGQALTAFVRMAQRPFLLLARMEKPTVAAVQGHALGAGFQLALACDLRVATAEATFGILEARYGLIPDLGGSHHLARLVGAARAKELVWSARTMGAEEAERLGLVNRVAGSAQDLPAVAEALLRDVTAHSPIVVSLVKSLIDHAPETPLEVELERESQAQMLCVQSHDGAEAIASHVERRPHHTGR
jgi:enoyl-CoA hydratase/carnithine racemase